MRNKPAVKPGQKKSNWWDLQNEQEDEPEVGGYVSHVDIAVNAQQTNYG